MSSPFQDSCTRLLKSLSDHKGRPYTPIPFGHIRPINRKIHLTMLDPLALVLKQHLLIMLYVMAKMWESSCSFKTQPMNVSRPSAADSQLLNNFDNAVLLIESP